MWCLPQDPPGYFQDRRRPRPPRRRPRPPRRRPRPPRRRPRPPRRRPRPPRNHRHRKQARGRQDHLSWQSHTWDTRRPRSGA
ncbi:MAG: hypothetical protein EB832_00075 [Thaumarchaeota archaeon S14]|nr:MAG: hypothetical protein EB832_00075 [Thaumarchaeota archaeon S14]